MQRPLKNGVLFLSFVVEMNSIFLRIFILFFCGLSAGCNPFQAFRPDSEELVQLGWAKQPKCPKTPEPIYCYETLGRTVCHSAPLDDQSRLSGHYGTKP